MPVTTVPADQLSWINARSVVALNSNANTNTTTTTKKPTHKNPKTTSTPNTTAAAPCNSSPHLDLVTPDSPVAFDREGVELVQETGKRRTGVGRLSIVNITGQVIYDAFVYYPATIPHLPPPQRLKLGVTHADIKPENNAQPTRRSPRDHESESSIKSGVVVAHAALNHTQMLEDIGSGEHVVHDTQRIYGASLGPLSGFERAFDRSAGSERSGGRALECGGCEGYDGVGFVALWER